MELEIRSISLDEAIAIRHQFLKPHLPPDETLSPGDLDPEGVHLGAFLEGTFVGAMSAGPEQCPLLEVVRGSWRLRGFAVYPQHRAKGIGTRLLEEIIASASASSRNLLWGTPRLRIVDLYRRFGFETIGEPFEIEPSGLHQTVVRRF
ncbi:GNAT family N-acetyltransferase [Sinorhizobium meliloti]|uniref:GNAT family N-acetyltransferase n=1 Tax=Rhizobium meliloti TaxID=382 RepID=UPI000FD799E7|nr:GNAT family N-acetyltransferase [Sinorhizobium meliloti]RVG26265.1 GNAT family N-acetyltransferase [Sinorhizobium meliloti]